MARAAVYGMFLASGATALVYEVAWTRGLVLLLGGTQYAVSLILAAWMLGLALGAALIGRIADRCSRPLLVYGIIEGGVGALALLFPVLLDAARALSLAAGGSREVAFLAGFGVLLLPTTLMGATLPILSRFVVADLRVMGGRLGLLYGLNTLGAVAGTFLAGFVLVRELGVYASTYVAAAGNLAIAIAAVVLFLVGAPGARSPSAESASSPPLPKAPLPGLPLVAFAAGLIALGSEVLWTRMLTFFLEGFTYTFAAMLTTFLLGLSLGALLSGFLVDRIRDLRRYLGWLFVASAVVSAGVLLALTSHFEITNWAKRLTESVSRDWRTHHAASLFLAAFVVLFPPALVMGGIFPAVARLATRHAGEVGARVGRVYALNTLGSVAGALVSGLLLIRVLGMAWGAAVFAFLGVGVGLWLLGRRFAVRAAPLAAGVLALVILAGPSTPFILHSHVFRDRQGIEWELLSCEEGIYGAVSVLENHRKRETAIYTDDFQAAATGPRYKYMRLLAHLPLLLAPRWEGAEVLVICFGTGTTAGSASVHPIGGLDIVEIAAEVLDQADRFRDVNKGILDEDPSRGFPVRVHVDDGRNFLLRADRTWDLITLEPLMPYTPGAVSFYTEDFYRLCLEKLSPGGLACQWIPIHAMSGDDYRMLVRSFVEVFPNSSLWFVDGASLVIGSRDPLPIDYGRVAGRMRVPGIEADLDAIEFGDPRLVLNTFIASGPDLREFVKDAFLMTDERPMMEFKHLPYGFLNSYLSDNLGHLATLRRPVAAELDLSSVPAADRAALRASLEKYYAAGQSYLLARHHRAAAAFLGEMKETERQRERFLAALGHYHDAAEILGDAAPARYRGTDAFYTLHISEGLADLGRKNFAAAEKHLWEAVEVDPPARSDIAWTLLGRLYNRRGRHLKALECLKEALERFPRSPDALAERGFARFELGRTRRSLEDFHAAFDGPVLPEEPDAALLAAKKRAFQMERKSLIPEEPDPAEEAREALAALRAEGFDRKVVTRLRLLYVESPEEVRRALADDVASAREPDTPSRVQEFALEVFTALGDLDGTLDLLRTGAPLVREKAADVLGRVKQKPVIPALIGAMGDSDREVREAAMASLFGVSGRQQPGYDPDGPPEARAAALEKLEEWWRKVGPTWRFD